MLDDDTDEYLWPGSDDRSMLDYRYEIRRQPQRAGQPLELPQGIVIDPGYSGASASGNEFAAASGRLLVMYSPTGGVASASYIDQATGNLVEDTGVSKLYLLVGRTEQVDYAWQNVPASNVADGGNLWLTINRRTGAVGTVENAPNVALPIGTAQERAAYLSTAREFATAGDVTGGQ